MRAHRRWCRGQGFHSLLHCLAGLIVALVVSRTRFIVEAASSPSSTPEVTLTPPRESTTMMATAANDSNDLSSIQIVFSDVDGTLVHYPENASEDNRPGILKLPPSATGMQGIISSRTLRYCAELRRKSKTKLVLVSGMRTTTLLKRIPYLPRADAYCSEAGGRIFYPTDPSTNNDKDLTFTPVSFVGATKADLAPFGLREDMECRRRMERPIAAGTQGYQGNNNGLANFGGDLHAANVDAIVPVSERNGLLWEYAQRLIDMGYVLDTKGYSACFRVNRSQQTSVTDEEFNALMTGRVPCPAGLGTSTNLGCIDFYPVESGKKHCCLYVAHRLCNSVSGHDAASLSLWMTKHAICLCDDDNDLEMALACQHAFVPGVSSESMARVIRDHPGQITVTGGSSSDGGLEGTDATEKALELALERIRKKS